tara:strand:- start:1058 stop:1264 length:207 start_codon:yes stop_codon:yes gene_type:complete
MKTQSGQFKIFCQVWGGVTGSRESFMKNNGEEMLFDNRAEAGEYAQKARDRRSTPYETAQYRYTVVDA